MRWSSVGLAVLISVASVQVWADPARFDNYRIYNVDVETQDQLEVFQSMVDKEGFSFAYDPFRVGQHLKVTVSPEQLPYFEYLEQSMSLKSTLLVKDVQQLINKEQLKSRADGFSLDEFNRLDAINDWLDSLVVTYPGIVTKIEGGVSHEGRTLEGVKLTKNEDNPVIFIESGIHANEWITSSSALWMINELLTSTDPEVQSALDNFTWYILPIVNPDGFEYSHTNYRMWRKNRSRNGLICWGTDLNRNWDIEWKSDGNSTIDPCGTTYIGSAPFAEIEVRSLSEYITTLKDKIKLYLSFHSAINMIMCPYGYQAEPPANYDHLNEILTEAYGRLFATHGMDYKFGPLYTTLYPANGVSVDWVYDVLDIKLAFIYEFRDQTADGEFYGFITPPEEIRPNAEEVFQGILGMIQKGGQLGYFD